MLKNKLLSAMGGVEANYIEDVFSTYLYTGNSSTQTITNGIDLAGEGGLFWGKQRDSTGRHWLLDSARGGNTLSTNLTDAQSSAFGSSPFTSTGLSFTATNPIYNASGSTYASWTFRKQPKFFDVVTYTGNSTASRQISHNLGSTPGCIIIKSTTGGTAGYPWIVWHTSLSANTYLQLNTTDAAQSSSAYVSAVSSTTFTINSSQAANLTGDSYVAYLFAHNAGGFGLTGTDNVISCGSFTTDGAGIANVTLGYEPQWLLTKKTNTGSWQITDTMRGWATGTAVYASNDAALFPNLSNAEFTQNKGHPTATGFNYEDDASATYIYIAIRRGPMKVPTTGTSVFKPQVITANGAINAGFPSDSTLTAVESSLRPWPSRLTGGKPIYTNNTNAESGSSFYNYGFSQNSYDYTFGTGGSSRATMYDFRRAPGFFDVVCYTGNSTNQTIAHNLGVAPELMIAKKRSGTGQWPVYAQPLGATKYLQLNTSSLETTGVMWNNTAPTASVFSVGADGDSNLSGATYVAYLFATLANVSKVGSYTGTGTTQTIDCGFTGGARFVMIKRTDTGGDWYVWDSARGIVAGNDPYLLLNTTGAEVTSTDYIDTFSAGFEISSTAPSGINGSGGTFIFLAIA